MNTRYQTLRNLLAVCMAAFSISACLDIKLDDNISGPPPSSSTRVLVKNSTFSAFSIDQDPQPIPINTTRLVLDHLSTMPNFFNPNSFVISKLAVPVARVKYQVLRYPTTLGETQNVIMDVSQAIVGTMEVTVPDSVSTWISIVSVQAL